MPTERVPVEGSMVREGTVYVKDGKGGVQVVSAGGPAQTAQPAPPPVQPAQVLQAAETQVEQAPARDLTLIEQFHPSLDPTKVSMSWDEKTGKVRITPIEATAPVTEETVDDPTAPPALSEQHSAIPGGSEAHQATASSSNEIAELKAQLAQMTQLVTVIAQNQLAGQPSAQAQQATEPDYSQVDLYEPSNLAAFIQQTVQGAINGAMAPHQQTIEGAKRRQEYDATALKFGSEANFHNKSVAAIQLVADNPGLTIEQAYGIVSKISQTISTQGAQPAQQPAAQPVKPATRTITAEQAQQKAEQAQRLPVGNSGVRGAGAPPMPAHIKGLGQMIAWNLQQASLGNQ